MTRNLYNALCTIKSECLKQYSCDNCELFTDDGCTLRKSTPNCYDVLQFRNTLSDEPKALQKHIAPCGEVKIKGNFYQDFTRILIANGYVVTVTVVDGDCYYIQYGKCK